MKVNWKELAKTEGYQLFKKAYIRMLNIHNYRKDDIKKIFYSAIGEAQSLSCKTNIPMHEILYTWEVKRRNSGNNWSSFYSDFHLKPWTRHHRNQVNPEGIRGQRKRLRKSKHYTKAERKKSNCDLIQRTHKKNLSQRRKDKPRWPVDPEKRKSLRNIKKWKALSLSEPKKKRSL